MIRSLFSIKIYVCEECSFRTESKTILKHHYIEVHDIETKRLIDSAVRRWRWADQLAPDI